jgi:hypothetical protein
MKSQTCTSEDSETPVIELYYKYSGLFCNYTDPLIDAFIKQYYC